MNLFPKRKYLPRNYDLSSVFVSAPQPHFTINPIHSEEYQKKSESGEVKFYEEPYGSKFHKDYQRFASIFFKKTTDLKYIMKSNSKILRTTKAGFQEIRVDFTEFDRKTYALILQRYNTETGKALNNHFSFTNEEIIRLKEFLNSLDTLPIKGNSGITYSREKLEEINNAQEFIANNKELIKELIGSKLEKGDIEILKHRKKQLQTFRRMLDDEDYFNMLCEKKNIRGKEGLWQEFFEKNDWIFGYGLSYIFTTSLDNKKLEQYVNGYSFIERGKRVDAVLKTRGLINSLCFAEIKHHKTDLLDNKSPYRAECWKVSSELSGAVAQIQKTVQKAVKSIETEIRIKDKAGNPTNETLYIYQPKSFIVVGSLDEFKTDNGINEEKFSSFELFRQNIRSPEIITFDELYERARFITDSKHESL